jgi:hypothetical protein
LPEQTFVPHSAALVNDANEGIAHIVMPNSKDSQQICDSIVGLAEHVAEETGIAPHTPFLPSRGVALKSRRNEVPGTQRRSLACSISQARRLGGIRSYWLRPPLMHLLQPKFATL